ncbi:hypothetical protein [Bosea sp. FBZP-16]|uniref:hypothetical protein n=1 Tax=Bosea sp. FBZP-16 TaxID=2065382 RepID=UPI0018F88772|nr:hypothetical protein [Bosea sp. FBZP-16]
MTDWIEWNGGECPVGRKDRVQVKLRDGYVTPQHEEYPAESFVWNHAGGRSWEIIAYRLAEQDAFAADFRVPESALTRQPGGTHYRDSAIQPVQFIEANKLGFLEGCIIKRVARHDKPTGKGREDIEKIIHEAQLLLELRYGAVA